MFVSLGSLWLCRESPVQSAVLILDVKIPIKLILKLNTKFMSFPNISHVFRKHHRIITPAIKMVDNSINAIESKK